MLAEVRTPVAETVSSVLFVGMDREFIDAFRKDFAHVTVLTVAHAAAARERIPVTRPFVVVVATWLAKDELQELVDIATGVGAETIRMPGEVATPIGYFRIKKALIEALERRRR